MDSRAAVRSVAALVDDFEGVGEFGGVLSQIYDRMIIIIIIVTNKIIFRG
jgi:hypothetical protein